MFFRFQYAFGLTFHFSGNILRLSMKEVVKMEADPYDANTNCINLMMLMG